MRWSAVAGLVLCMGVSRAPAAYVVSNAMSGARYSNLAAAVTASVNGDRLVMIGDATLSATLTISNRILTIVSDGSVRTIRGSTNCSYDMIAVVGTNATLTLGATNGSDAAPTLVFDGGRYSGVSNLYDMFYLEYGWLNLHPGVKLCHLASLDAGTINNVLGVVEMNGGRIENNSAPYGGGIFNNAGEIRMQGGSITGNLANVGGGIYNQSVTLWNGLITGYLGKLAMGGGAIADNVAYVMGGGIFNLGELELSGGRVERNAAPQGGGVVHQNGTTHGMILRGNAVVASNTATTGSGVLYNNDGNTWLSMAEGGRVVPPNDIYLATNLSSVLLTGPLTGRGTAAQLTPAAYVTNQSVVGAVWATNLWMVSNYYGKFSVTPEGGSGAWYVNSAGRLSRTNPAELAAAIGGVEGGATGLEMDIDPDYVAWDGVVDFATNVVGQAWNFQPLATNAYSVTNGRVVVVPGATKGVFRIRRQ